MDSFESEVWSVLHRGHIRLQTWRQVALQQTTGAATRPGPDGDTVEVIYHGSNAAMLHGNVLSALRAGSLDWTVEEDSAGRRFTVRRPASFPPAVLELPASWPAPDFRPGELVYVAGREEPARVTGIRYAYYGGNDLPHVWLYALAEPRRLTELVTDRGRPEWEAYRLSRNPYVTEPVEGEEQLDEALDYSVDQEDGGE